MRIILRVDRSINYNCGQDNRRETNNQRREARARLRALRFRVNEEEEEEEIQFEDQEQVQQPSAPKFKPLNLAAKIEAVIFAAPKCMKVVDILEAIDEEDITEEMIRPKVDSPDEVTITTDETSTAARAIQIREKFSVSRSDSWMRQSINRVKWPLISPGRREPRTSTWRSSSSLSPRFRR